MFPQAIKESDWNSWLARDPVKLWLKRAPRIVTVLMVIALVSLAADVTWLAVVGVAFSVIGLFYYLRLVRLMYFDKPADPAPVAAPSDMQVMISTNALAILALGVYPTGLMAICISAFGG